MESKYKASPNLNPYGWDLTSGGAKPQEEVKSVETPEDAIKNFRDAWKKLPVERQEKELERALRIIRHKPIVVFEDWATGQILKFPDVDNLIKYLKTVLGISTANKSMIYRCLRGEYERYYGHKIKYEYEED